MIENLLKEMELEAHTTRKMLAKVPEDRLDWQPHPKSMTIKSLAAHIAELPSWVSLVLTTSELDFEKTPYTPYPIQNTAELLSYFEKNYEMGKNELSKAKDADLNPDWILRSGETIISKTSKGEMLRHTYSQIVHHRAQLGVFLRLLDVPIPGSYGPSADEM
jgi:uncharacterized damage-inducible protein DinB